MTEIVESFLPTWETCIEFLALKFGLVQYWMLQTDGEDRGVLYHLAYMTVLEMVSWKLKTKQYSWDFFRYEGHYYV